jgi:anti-repressor protein
MRLDADKRTLVSIEGASNGLQVNAVNESGLYSLILTSRKPEAKRFKKWVTSDVLPSIRKTGSYNADPMAALQGKKNPGLAGVSSQV